MLGREQKAWLKERLTRSTATWNIWGATNGTLDMRTDPQKLPPAGFDPVGLSYITGSISAPGLAEAAEYMKDSPLLPLFVRKTPGARPRRRST